MARLIAFLFTTVPAMFSYLLAQYARKYTTAVAALLAFGSMLLIFIGCINVILQAVLAMIVLPAWLTTPIGMFVPSNFAIAVSAMVSGRICKKAWDMGKKKVELITYSN